MKYTWVVYGNIKGIVDAKNKYDAFVKGLKAYLNMPPKGCDNINTIEISVYKGTEAFYED